MANCKGCGKFIRWGVTEDGKKIPLDPRPPVYAIIGGSLHSDGELRVERRTTSLVSHFGTCPKASDFSASKRKDDLPGLEG